MMPVYVIVAPRAVGAVESYFKEEDRCKVAPGVWFVRSGFTMSTEVIDAIGINKKRTGTVARTFDFSGYAKSEIVEKISRWESTGD